MEPIPLVGNVLVVIAHPDDEVFASGTIWLLAEKGFKITLICVTDGESGSNELLYAGSSLQLGEVRRRELALSAWVLGVNEVLFLGQPDAVVTDWRRADTLDQVSLSAALEHIIQQYDPELILTHGPLGGYGHSAHRTVHTCVMAAARKASFSGSIFSFCGQVRGAFFSWHFDQPSSVLIDVRGALRRRAASLSYHQTQTEYFLKPYFPQNIRKYLSAGFGFIFAWNEAGRKRVPIATAVRFFRRFPVEGLVMQKAPNAGKPHFFLKHYANDCRVTVGPKS